MKIVIDIPNAVYETCKLSVTNVNFPKGCSKAMIRDITGYIASGTPITLNDMEDHETWSKFWAQLKDHFSVGVIADILGMKEQSLRNKIHRDSDVTMKEVSKIYAFISDFETIYKDFKISKRE